MRDECVALRVRLKELQRSSELGASEWRRLQYDAVAAFVNAQRKLIAMHGELLGLLRSDRDLYHRQRVESLELGIACDELRELIREIERGTHSASR